jgi:hypothetical protein
MKAITYKVSLDFANYSDPELDEFGGNSVTCLTGNTAFPNPPVKPADLDTQVSAFRDAIQAALPGGIQLTAAKNAKREIVLTSLRQNAYYVQTIASADLDMLLSSGYFAISTNRSSVPLDKPAITAIENPASTQLLVRVTPVVNARSYHMQTGTNGTWQDAGIHLQARRIVLPGLTPGTVYNVRVRAIGGSTGSSDWSDPQSHIST